MFDFDNDLGPLLRAADIIGQSEVTPEQAARNAAAGKGIKRPRPGRRGIVNASAPTLWRWVRDGEFPPPIKIGPRLVAWRAEDVRAWRAKRKPAVA